MAWCKSCTLRLFHGCDTPLREGGVALAPACSMRSSRSDGFTLVETLVAGCLLVVGLMALAELAVYSLRADAVAGTMTYAALLAGDKVEGLRTVALGPSPPGTLDGDVPGYVEHLDGTGRVVGADARTPVGAVYTRRWEITALPGVTSAWVVQVDVRPGGTTGGLGAARVAAVLRGEAAAP